MDCGCEKIEMEKEKAKVWIPLDSDLSQFEMGSSVEITIKGKINGGSFHLDDDDWRASKGEISVEVESVSVEGKNVFESLID